MNNKLLAALAVGLCLSFGAAHAAEKHRSPQQHKQAVCQKEAKGKKGAERRAFMKECLGSHHIAHTHPHQSRSKPCNAEAKHKNLKGPERKAFMKECLARKPD